MGGERRRDGGEGGGKGEGEEEGKGRRRGQGVAAPPLSQISGSAPVILQTTSFKHIHETVEIK